MVLTKIKSCFEDEPKNKVHRCNKHNKMYATLHLF